MLQPWSTAPLAGAAIAVAVLTMAVLWAIAWRLRNAGIVDVGWTYLVATLAVMCAALGPGWPSRRLLVAVMFGVWGLRLGTYLLVDRVIGRPEDGRYADLRRSWGVRANARFFWFFQAQALAAVFFALPALLGALNPVERLSTAEGLAMALWMVSILGESIADLQLKQFKADAAHHGQTCTVGLWRYSRHPNYFFEWLTWVAFALFATAAPLGWLAAACPLVMLYLLFRVTGIPATEAQALRSRGDAYRRYQQTTSAFVPWWPSAGSR